MSVADEDPRPSLEERSIHPRVRLPQAGLSGWAIALLCALLGLVLFVILDANRRSQQDARQAPASPRVSIASPPPLSIPPMPVPVEPERPPPAPVPLVPEAQAVSVERNAPIVYPALPPSPVASLPGVPTGPAPTPVRKAEPGGSPLIIDLGAGDALGNGSAAAGAAGDDQAVRASIIRNRASLVPQGSMIRAILETPIDSRRPGLVRAIVARDARGFDGSRVLIPKGSRLIGEAAGDAKEGQKRVLVTWTRLIRPDGVAIRIGSPAADVLGGAGIRGKTNTHFFERFGNAVLQSALTIGVNIASRPRGNSVIVGVPGQIGAAGQSLLPNVDTAPTIKIASGTEISVFVARDLDFSGAAGRP